MWCLGLSLVYFVGRLHPIASWAAGNKVPLARRGSLAIQVEQTHLSAGRKHHIHVEFKRSNSEEEIADKEDREKDQAKGRRQRRRRRSRRASANVSPVSQSTDITIVSFTNYETLELAINWLQHLEDAIGAADMKAALLMYALGDDTQAVLLNTGHIHSSCIR